jgi:hypothetical protein
MKPLTLTLLIVVMTANAQATPPAGFVDPLPVYTMSLRELPPASNPVMRLSSSQEGLDLGYVPHEATRHFGLAVGEVAILEFIPWALARWIREWEDPADNWAKVSSDTWWNNLSKGWEYDGDNFLTNLYAHPYHGALFFNAGRANGYTYWESLPFSLAGSAAWEYFGETFRPAFNDWIMTGFNGSFFGEGLYRLSVLMTDNTATGSERVWREIGGALVNPVRGFNRLITGETGRLYPNPPEHDPKVFNPVLSAGVRQMDADGDDLVKDAVTQAVVALDLRYGSLFEGDYKTPFSSFGFNITLAFPNREVDSSKVMNRLSVEGVLFGWKLSKDESVTHLITVRGIYDYLSNPAFEFGQTAVSPELNSLYRLSDAWKLQIGVGVRAILMGGTANDYYVDVEGRNYDLGPGTGTRLTVSFLSGGWDVVSLMYNGGWIWTQSEPSKSKHNFHIATISGRYPFTERLAAGIDLAVYWRESFYERSYYDQISPSPAQAYMPQVQRRNPIARLVLSYVAW